jgi:HK97 family phage major capsid protein
MADSIESVREEYSKALEAFQAAAAAIEEFDPEAEVEEGADAPSLDELEATFTGAEEDYKATSAKLELFKRTQEARSIALPDTPGAGDVRITNEPAIYSRELAQREGRSIFRDLYNRDVKHDSAAGERIASHGRQMADRAEFDLNSTDATGGYLVAPLYLQDEYISLARAGRVTADVLGPKPLPPNTDSINVPRMTTGTAVAIQADNNAVQETDAAFGTLAADVKTIAGLQDVSQQLIDRGVPGVDEVIFADLAKAYAVKLDTDVLNSSDGQQQGPAAGRHALHLHLHGGDPDRVGSLLQDRRRDPGDRDERLHGAGCDHHAPPPLGVDSGRLGHDEPSAGHAVRADERCRRAQPVAPRRTGRRWLPAGCSGLHRPERGHDRGCLDDRGQDHRPPARRGVPVGGARWALPRHVPRCRLGQPDRQVQAVQLLRPDV